MDGPTKQGVESRSTRLKNLLPGKKREKKKEKKREKKK